MKTIKNKLSQRNYFVAPVGDKEQNKYLKQIAYWVGYYVFEFNNLDNTITDLAAERIDGHLEKNDYAYIFLTGLTFNQKIELLERYYNFQFGFSLPDPKSRDVLREKTGKIITELKNAGKTRNTIIHANYYSLDINGNIKEKTKLSGSDVEEFWVTINRDFLIENINSVIDLRQRIEELDEEFY